MVTTSVQKVDLACENWSNLESMADRIVALQKDARVKSRKDKAFMRTVLGACLAASGDEKQNQHKQEDKVISSFQDWMDSLQGHIVTLKDEVEDLKFQLEEGRR